MQRDPKLLLDMLNAARDVQTFNKGVSNEQYANNLMLQYATERGLQIIGEAAWRVSAGFKQRHREIPCEKIAGLRHRLVHEYGAIDQSRLQAIVNSSLGELIAQLERLVPVEGDLH